MELFIARVVELAVWRPLFTAVNFPLTRAMKQLFALLLLCLNVGVLWGQGDVRQRGSGGDQSSQPAQSRRVTGRVLDASGQPVSGATVAVVDRRSGKTITGTYSDANGNFAVNVDPNADLNIRISSIGYAAVVQPITPTTSALNVTLKEEDTTLETQVIDVGIGTIDRTAKTGTIYTVKGEEFRNMPVQSFTRAITGRMAGVSVLTQNGVPGALPQVRIRGIGTITAGQQPLYIIDGVRMSVGPNQGVGSADRARGAITGSILNSINPNDIEEMTVLVEASQTAPYGAEGANGVIVIRTRRGKVGKTRVSFDYSRGFTELIRKPDMMNATEWEQYIREANTNAGNSLTTFNNTYGPFIQAGNNFDHVGDLYRTGTVENFDVSVSGGSEKTTFSLSANYNFADAITRGVNFERGLVRANLTHNIDEIWRVEFNTNMSMVETSADGTVSQGGSFTNNIQRSALMIPPVTPMVINGDFNLGTGLTGLTNYLSELRNSRGSIQNGIITSINLVAQIKPWLKSTTTAGLDWSEIEERIVLNPLTQTGSGTNGTVSNLSSRDISYMLETRFNMTHQFEGGHTLSGVVGVNFRQESRRTLTATGNALAFPGLDQLNNTTTPATAAGNFVQSAKINFFNQAAYNYKERYYVTASLGISSSSRFGPERRFGYFPSVSGKIRLANEPWFPKPEWLNELAIRGSIGETGNDNIAQNGWVPNIGTAAAYNSLPGLGITTLTNLQFGWETNRITDAGLEVSMFDNRIDMQLAFFNRQTVDALLTRQVSAFGATPSTNTLIGNIAGVENVGWEWSLTTKNLTGEFAWETNVNLTYLENKITALPNNNQDDPANGRWFDRVLGAVWVAKYAGVNPADGRPMFFDRNQNITYFPTQADNQFLTGNSQQPTFFGNLTNRFTWKGFTLEALLSWETGRLNSISDRFFVSYGRTERNQTRDMLNRWTTPGQVTGVPIAWFGSVGPGFSSASVAGSGNESSTIWSKADFIRLRQISLSYQLPTSVVSKLGLSSLAVYCQAVNLFTYTTYIGVDPEVLGTDASVIPQAKSFVAGVTITL